MMQVMSREQGQASQVAQQPTLFFMPHCSFELTESLLQVNWDTGTLPNVAILGNSFHKHCLSRTSQVAALNRITHCYTVKAVLEVPVREQDPPHGHAFRDLALQVFPRADLASFDSLPLFLPRPWGDDIP